MGNTIVCIGMIIINFILYLAFGSFLTRFLKKEAFSVTLTLFVGFFFYYSLFSIVCVPMMIRLRPLSELSKFWGGLVIFIVLLSFLFHWKMWAGAAKGIGEFIKGHWIFFLCAVALSIVQVVVIVNAYHFTLDATFYVGTVSTSVYTDRMNIFNPYTGAWQDHFELRYFFATYPIHDAVVCQITGIHPLIETKTIMSSVVVLFTNIIYYKIASELWGEKKGSIWMMMFFAALIHFHYITIFTSANFLLTRTFEGKAIIGNVVLPALFYFFILFIRGKDSLIYWIMLFFICAGSNGLSTTANMLVPAALGIYLFPLTFIKKKWTFIPKCLACMAPGVVMMLLYVGYVKGYYVLYTYIR
ncbi:MAG: hypothetical protein HFI78_10820 [Lachnospiraceae bacterium]|jgi:hypothetical protein|nr:hypothetical protein [Lachnospiraceae bacterium]